MANVVDVATVKVGPDTTGFRQELRAKLSGIDESVDVNVNADADTTRASAVLSRWRNTQEVNAVNIPIRVDNNALNSAFRVVTSALKSFGIAGALSAALDSSTQAAVVLSCPLVHAPGAAWVLPASLPADVASAETVT